MRLISLSLVLAAFSACGGDDTAAPSDAASEAPDDVTDAPVDTGPADAAPEAGTMLSGTISMRQRRSSRDWPNRRPKKSTFS